jgi:catechol 2,3-dioxygenase-like lactoylglutathione lyase family enzyme
MKSFNIEALDHVALRVANMATSVEWYEKVLGLKKYQLPEWGDYPIFMLSNRMGVALFPLDSKVPRIGSATGNTIDHFAFRVSTLDFKLAQEKFSKLNLDFEFQDHHYFHSLYLKDPDNNTVELTTIMVDPESFY